MENKIAVPIILLFILSVSFMGCQSTKLVPEKQIEIKSTELDYSGFFLTGKTSYNIEGKMVSSSFKFTNYLEGTDYEALPNGEDVVLKGTTGEMWRSSFEKVQKTYTNTDGSQVEIEDFTLDSFINLKTMAKGMTNFALHLPLNYLVEVQTSWGDILYANRPDVPHGNGDFLLCRKGEDGKPDLSDVWVVNGKTFPNTYNMANAK